jgi:8-oxo-dGTP diphosphatase
VSIDPQATHHNSRYTVIPRTLCLLTHGDDVLLLRGAPNKRLWAGRLNGVGGHIEAGEDPASSARREILEETGLVVEALDLRAIVHVAGEGGDPGVLLFVYVAAASTRAVHPSAEGALAWYPLADLLAHRGPLRATLVDDLPDLLPRIIGPGWSGALVYGYYAADADGVVRRWRL